MHTHTHAHAHAHTHMHAHMHTCSRVTNIDRYFKTHAIHAALISIIVPLTCSGRRGSDDSSH